jgi:hypothetical protein
MIRLIYLKKRVVNAVQLVMLFQVSVERIEISYFIGEGGSMTSDIHASQQVLFALELS